MSWTRTVSTTIRKYVRDAVPTLLRSQKLLAKLESMGRVETNLTGTGRDWKVEYRRAAVNGNLGDTPIEFSAVDRFQTAFLAYRGLYAVDSMSKREFLANRGQEAIIKYYSQMAQRLMDDMRRKMGTELYVDGNASGNEYTIHGMESWFGRAGQSINSSTGAKRSYNAADYVLSPDDSYAGLDTDLQAYGGSWTGVWPNDGVSDQTDTYDFFSPVIVNYLSSSFGGTAQTWAVQCVDAIRFAITATEKDSSNKGRADLCLLDRDLYRQFKTKLDSKERINIENTGLRELGFKDVINLDGVDVTSEFGVPSARGYLLNCNQLTLGSSQESLLGSEGPEWDIKDRAFNTVVDFLGNMFCESPKYFATFCAGNV